MRRNGQKHGGGGGVSRMTEHGTGRDEVLAGCQSLLSIRPVPTGARDHDDGTSGLTPFSLAE